MSEISPLQNALPPATPANETVHTETATQEKYDGLRSFLTLDSYTSPGEERTAKAYLKLIDRGLHAAKRQGGLFFLTHDHIRHALATLEGREQILGRLRDEDLQFAEEPVLPMGLRDLPDYYREKKNYRDALTTAVIRAANIDTDLNGPLAALRIDLAVDPGFKTYASYSKQLSSTALAQEMSILLHDYARQQDIIFLNAYRALTSANISRLHELDAAEADLQLQSLRLWLSSADPRAREEAIRCYGRLISSQFERLIGPDKDNPRSNLVSESARFYRENLFSYRYADEADLVGSVRDKKGTYEHDIVNDYLVFFRRLPSEVRKTEARAIIKLAQSEDNGLAAERARRVMTSSQREFELDYRKSW